MTVPGTGMAALPCLPSGSTLACYYLFCGRDDFPHYACYFSSFHWLLYSDVG